MGFRSAVKKGGGFLVGDGTLAGYEFSRKFHGETKNGDWVYLVPSILMDGADEPVTQHLFLGGADRYEISDDGQELSGDSIKFGGTPAGRLIESMLDAGDKAGVNLEEDLSDIDAGEPLSLAGIVGRRFTFGKEIDVKGNEKRGKKPRVKDGQKVLDPKTGKQIMDDRTNMIITAVLGMSNGNGSKSTKPATKGIKVDLSDEAEAILRDIVENQEVSAKNLALFVAKKLMKLSTQDKPKAEALKAKILDVDFQDALSWFTKDKKGMLSVSE